jgi:hypothetical protein
MIKTTDIALVADTPFTFPDDFTGRNIIDGDTNITESEVQKFDESSLSFTTAGTVEIEFDYGLGFNELFSQTDQNQAYKSTAVRKVRLTSLSQANTAVLTFTKKIGGL